MNTPPQFQNATEYKENLQRSLEQLTKKLDPQSRIYRIVENAMRKIIEEDNYHYASAIMMMKRVPVDINEFMESPEFLAGSTNRAVLDVWPSLKRDIRIMNPDVWVGEKPVFEAFLGGATGTGKTISGSITNLYQLYLLTCFDEPQRLFNLSKFTQIIFLFQSTSTLVADRAIYRPFRQMFLAMEYTKKHVIYEKYKESSLILPDLNIEVATSIPNVESMVGQAIIGCILDEVNFYEVIEQSKKATGPRGLGGHYDQAEEAYTTISRRRASRFTTQGPSIGCLCVSSSTRYASDFLDRRIEKAIKNDQKNIYWARHKQYEIQPAEKYSGNKFKLLIGTKDYPTQVLEDDAREGKDYPKGGKIELVPIENRDAFVDDPENALRDIIGIATEAITPFITQRDKIVEAMNLGTQSRLINWTTQDEYDLARDGMPVIDPKKLPADRDTPRFLHVDLSISTDRCGIAVVKPTGFMKVVDGEGNAPEALPTFELEMAITIKPAPHRNLDISEVRQFVMALRSKYGINIVSANYDGYMSRESIQLLQKTGMQSKVLSVDKTIEPYMDFRRAIYQGRIALLDHELLATELSQLEHNVVKNKVDHPPKGTKDISDAVCGAFYAASRNRVVRADAHVIGHTRQRKEGAKRRTVSHRRATISRRD